MVGKTAPGMRLGTLLVTIALAVSSCSGDDAAAETTVATTVPTTTTAASTTAPPTTAAPTTTTAAPPTTVDPLARPDVLVSNVDRSSADDFDTTGDNPWIVMLELRDLFVFLEGTPSGTAEEMVALVFEPTYPYWDPILAGFEELAANPGWRYSDPGVETLGIDLVEMSGEIAVLRVADQRGEQVISDADGSTVKTYEGWNAKVTTITLRRGPDSKWRYADLAPSQPITAEELSSMVPVDWIGRPA